MKIVLINQYAIAFAEAGGTRHLSLARELVARGNDVTIITSGYLHSPPRTMSQPDGAGTFRREDIDGVEFVRVDTPSYVGNGFGRMWNMLYFTTAVLRSRTSISSTAPDVVVGSSPHPFAALAAYVFAKRMGAAFVLEVRDLWPASVVQVAGMPRYHPLVLLVALLERFLYRVADMIITVLPRAHDYIAARGAKREDIRWIPNGVDFKSLPANVERPAGSGNAALTVIYAGSHGVANALDSMVEVARILEKRQPGRFCFRFFGDGTERRRLASVAASEGLQNVKFEGAVPKAEIFKKLAEADILLASTLNSDLYDHGISPNKLFDYLAACKPIVFGSSDEFNPVAVAGAGLVVKPEDSIGMAKALESLASMSASERAEMGLKGLLWAQAHCDIRQLAESFEHVCAEAQSRRRGR